MEHYPLKICLAAPVLAVLVACGPSTRQVMSNSPSIPAGVGSAERSTNVAQTPNITEQSLAREVRHELILLPYYGVFDNLAYRISDGTVTLLGQVTRPTLKGDAENVVKN